MTTTAYPTNELLDSFTEETGFEYRIAADVLLDSTSNNNRLITFVLRFPRFILAEVNTHRAMSRNSASSRAIPIEKMMEAALTIPFVPRRFPLYKKGMDADKFVYPGEQLYWDMFQVWQDGIKSSVETTRRLAELGCDKQIANRPMEPYMWHTAIITANMDWQGWENFINLRTALNAQGEPLPQPEMYDLAVLVRDAIASSETVERTHHLPFVLEDELGLLDNREGVEELLKVSAARCARVSYLTHDKVRDHGEEMHFAEGLARNGHMSPFEHCAVAYPGRHGNFQGWRQLRQDLEGVV